MTFLLKISADLVGARLNVARTAELACMDPAHFRRLVRRGVFPKPERTTKGQPYYDYPLLVKLSEVLKSGVGVNQEEVRFNRRKPKQHRPRQRKSQPEKKDSDGYIQSIMDGCQELGIPKDRLDPRIVAQILAEEFGEDRPKLNEVLPVVARRILEPE